MAPAQPSTALLHAVSHWLQRWSDFALAAAAPAAGAVAPGALTDQTALSTAESNNGEAPAHWLTTVQTSTPPAHWLALLDAHGLTWDADQGITAQGEPTAEEPATTEAVQHEQTTVQTVKPPTPIDPVLVREGQPSRQEGLSFPSRKMPTERTAAQDSPAPLSVPEALAATQNTPSHPDLSQSDQHQAVAPPSVAAPQSYEQGSALPNPPSNLDASLVAWLTRLHQGVTALLSATTTTGATADLPALLRIYAPVAPMPTAVATATRPAEEAMPLPPALAPVSEPKQPSLVMTPITDDGASMPPTPVPPPVAPGKKTEPPVAPQRITRLQLRPPGMEQPSRKQPEDRSKDFSLSPTLNRSIEPQMAQAAPSGKVIADEPVNGTDLPGRLTGQPASVLTPPQPASLSATLARSQPAVQVTRLRVQAPGNIQTAAATATQPAQPAPSPVSPLPTARSLPADGTPPAPTQPVRAAKLATPLPARLLPAAPPSSVEADLPSPGDEQATRLARIEALLTRLLAEQNANGNHSVTPPPALVSSSASPPRNHWPTLPERSAKAERPPQRRSADPARRRRLEEEQRGRAWNG